MSHLLLGAALSLAPVLVAYAVRKHSKTTHEDAEQVARAPVADDSLFSLFQPHLIPIQDIQGYDAVLSLAQIMIGVQPTCDMVIALWPPAFECYNLVFPCLLNFPQLLLGRWTGAAPIDLVSFAMYASSKANGCSYCTSHCCSFAARRGVDHEVLSLLLDETTDSNQTHDESAARERRAVVKVAYGLGTVPTSITKQDVESIHEILSDSDVEWIVAATAMFGLYNKFMDGLGIPLEEIMRAETFPIMGKNLGVEKSGSVDQTDTGKPTPTPPTDDWTVPVACIYHGLKPGGALSLDAKLHGDTPKTTEGCLKYLDGMFTSKPTFSTIVSNLKHTRFARAVTAIIAKNFDPSVSAGLDVRLKIMAGIEFSKVLENDTLASIMKNAALEYGGSNEIKPDMIALITKLAKALSYTPSRATPELLQEIRDRKDLTAPMLVELVSFMATLQMLHRIEVFYRVKNGSTIRFRFDCR